MVMYKIAKLALENAFCQFAVTVLGSLPRIDIAVKKETHTISCEKMFELLLSSCSSSLI